MLINEDVIELAIVKLIAAKKVDRQTKMDLFSTKVFFTSNGFMLAKHIRYTNPHSVF
jgi:hypothetical protein